MGVMIVCCVCAGNLLAQPCGSNRADIYILVQEQLGPRAPIGWYAEEAGERIRMVSPEIQLLLTARDLPRCSFFPEYASYLTGRIAISVVDIRYIAECILAMAAEELDKGDRLRSIELAEFVLQIGCDIESPRIDQSTTLMGFHIQEMALQFLCERVKIAEGSEGSSYCQHWQEVIQTRRDVIRTGDRIISAAKKGDVDLLTKLFGQASGSLEKRMVLLLLDERMPAGKVRNLLKTAATEKDLSVKDLAHHRYKEFEPWWK